MTTAKERHPQIYVEHHEDPRQRVRKVPMEVLSLGFSRTGTMTMQAALEALGIPTWHWVTMSENPPDMDLWREALEAKFKPDSGIKPFGRSEFDQLLGNWGATTDQPASFMAEELISAYPEAKVVLIERDVDRWFQSYSETVINGTANPFIPIISLVDKTYIGQMGTLTDLTINPYFDIAEPRVRYGVLNNPKFFSIWRQKAKDVYTAHNEMIKRITPNERLLLFKLDDGWEPLAKFLGKPIPDMPFPRVNETTAVQEKINLYIAEGYRRSAVKFAKRLAPVAAILIAALLWWRFYRG